MSTKIPSQGAVSEPQPTALSPMERVRWNYRTLYEQPVVKGAVQGAVVGILTVGGLGPGLYWMNRSSNNLTFIPRECLRGTGLLAMSVVPTTVAAVTMDTLGRKALTREDVPPTNLQKVGIATLSGFASGVVGTFPENVALNLQNHNDPKEATVIAMTRRIYRIGGVAGLMRGWKWGGMREAQMGPSWLILSDLVAEKMESAISNPLVSLLVASWIVGAAVGVASNPTNVMRARIQNTSRTDAKPPSFRHIWRDVATGIGKAAFPRMVICSGGSVLMVGGRRLIFGAPEQPKKS